MTTEVKEKEVNPVMGHNMDGVRILMGQVSKKVDEINEGLKKYDEFFGEEPTENQRKEILEKGYDYVLEKLKGKFPFPKATDKFNFDAMGIDPSELKTPLNHSANRFRSLEYAELNGVWVEMTEGNIEDIYSRYEVVANTNRQREALEFAKELSELFNRYKHIVAKLGFHNASLEGRQNVGKFLRVVSISKEGFVPSSKGIKNLRN
ncbi:hypothetical protein M3P19_00855 [Muricauda sp. 2012CJ35-5]|uniref:Uncharacterized protein n=1 Tax=Flagellimonas spongiicola TaxID=2942208 RepID=A0ABT0PMD8_9FLAO|nr:hypothetical protein [Allomuricauda spongiicola]MCL6272534.1 hypothetical protein [Allomuricauda spongiicola]